MFHRLLPANLGSVMREETLASVTTEEPEVSYDLVVLGKLLAFAAVEVLPDL